MPRSTMLLSRSGPLMRFNVCSTISGVGDSVVMGSDHLERRIDVPDT